MINYQHRLSAETQAYSSAAVRVSLLIPKVSTRWRTITSTALQSAEQIPQSSAYARNSPAAVFI